MFRNVMMMAVAAALGAAVAIGVAGRRTGARAIARHRASPTATRISTASGRR